MSLEIISDSNTMLYPTQIPYWGLIPEGIFDGKVIKIQGSVPNKIGDERFHINLVTGSDLASDRALHISVEFKENIVVRNTLQHNVWGIEETKGPFPFAPGKDFTLSIFVEKCAFHITVDGSLAWVYSHRIPVSRVNMIFISGLVEIQQIEFIDWPTRVAELPCTPPLSTSPPSTMSLEVVSDPNSTMLYPTQIPYWSLIPDGIFYGKVIKMQGSVPHKIGDERFHINLVTGSDLASDRALHISVEFKENIVVRNTLQHNVWGIEETKGPFPFAPGKDFTLSIFVEKSAFHITVDGSLAWVYSHRIPVSRVNMIFISGLVEIQQIKLIDRPTQVAELPCTPPLSIPPSPSTMSLEVISDPITMVYPTQIPYWGLIPDGIFDGKVIKIQGSVPHKIGDERFHINLVTGSDLASDRALHISVEFKENIVVRNTLQHNVWGIEETKGPFPFAPGKDFTLSIFVEKSAFHITIDGCLAWVYSHRIPISRVNMIFISGLVEIQQIEFIDRPTRVAELPCTPPLSIPPSPSTMSLEVISDPNTMVYPTQIPYWGLIPDGIFDGKVIKIQGSVPHKIGDERFHINLVTGSDLASDRALHISVEFKENIVVRNTLQHNVWGIEETKGPFPFAPGKDFTLSIFVEKSAFHITVDGCLAWVYSHRIPVSRVNMIFISGLVKIQQIEFIDRPTRISCNKMVYILKVFLRKPDGEKKNIFFETPDKEKYEIRRTTINSSVTNDYNLLCDKIMALFPVLTGKCFNLEWIDSENDRITMSGNDELAHAIASADGELLRIYVSYELPKGPENSVCPSMPHSQVVCDSCNSEICGFRYKCLQCPDYDLCHSCSTVGKHSDHDMLKMAQPTSVIRDWVFPGWRKLWNSLFAYHAIPRKCFEGKKHRRHPNFANFGFYKKMDPVLRDLINFEYFGGAVGESNSDSEEAATCQKQSKTKNKQREPSKEDNVVPKDKKSDETEETTKPNTPEPEKKIVVDVPPSTNLYPDLHIAACGARPKTSTPSENCAETSVKMSRSACRETPDGTGEAEASAYPDGWTVLNAVKDDFLRESSKFVPFPKFLSEGVFARAHAYANGEGVKEHSSGSTPTTSEGAKEQVSAPINSEVAKEQASGPAPTNSEEAKEQVLSPAPIVDKPKKETSPHDATIANALLRMQAMGFTNEGGWLQRLLETKNGNINETLDALYPNTGRR